MLKTLQETFQTYLSDDNAAGTVFASIVEAKPNEETRLEIYHHAYRLRLLESLRSNFPTVLSLLGDEYFNTLGSAYLAAYPSTHFSVDQFGAKLPDFLKNYPGLHPAVYELALFEWSLGEVITAPDAAIAHKSALLVLAPEDWPNIQCILHPTVRWHFFEWQPMHTWKTLQQSPDESLLAPIQTQSTLCLFWRKDLQSYFRSISHPERIAFQALIQNQTFSEICDTLCEQFPEEVVASQFSQLLSQWLEEGIISDLKIVFKDDLN